MADVRVGIAGITGRMGRILAQTALDMPGVALGAASTHSQNELLVGHDIGEFIGRQRVGVSISSSLEYCYDGFDVAIDFTSAEYTQELAGICARQGKGLVIGTTAHDEAQMQAIREAAEQIPIVKSPNMSVGINLMLNLLRDASRVLGMDADVDVLETHHRRKKDAPSGTGYALGRAVAEGREQEFAECAAYKALESEELRDPSAIHFHVMRQADVVGEHQVVFAIDGERLEIAHRAADRDIFARGAMRAAVWVSGQKPGLHTMQDVLAR